METITTPSEMLKRVRKVVIENGRLVLSQSAFLLSTTLKLATEPYICTFMYTIWPFGQSRVFGVVDWTETRYKDTRSARVWFCSAFTRYTANRLIPREWGKRFNWRTPRDSRAYLKPPFSSSRAFNVI